MLSLVAGNHVHRLLNQIEVEVLIRHRWSEIEVAIDEALRARIEKGVDVTLIPPRLLDWLKLAI